MNTNDDEGFEFYAAGELVDEVEAEDALPDVEAFEEEMERRRRKPPGIPDPDEATDEDLSAAEQLKRLRRMGFVDS